MANNKENNISLVAKTIVFAVIVAIVVLVIFLLTNNSETRISENVNEGDLTSLNCISTSLKEPFFVSGKAQRYEHEIKVMFINNRFKESSYTYEGTFNSHETAENQMAEMHTKYNKFMEASGVYQEILNPVFMTDKSKVRVSLYMEPKDIYKATAGLFYMSDDVFSNLDKASEETFKKMYEDVGFTCQIHE